jgi:hypothetical protein
MGIEDWRIDGIDRKLDRIERQLRNQDERGERRAAQIEGRVNSIYQMLLERTAIQLAVVALVALVAGLFAAHR